MLTGCGNAVACKDATVSGSDCVTLESQIIDGKYFPRYAYEFTDSRNYGVTQFSDEQIEFEAMNGIRIDTSGGQIKYCVYHHALKNIDTKNVKVRLYNAETNKFIKELPSMSVPDGQSDSEWRALPDKLSDGLYKLESAFIYIPDNSECLAAGYIYVKNGKAQTCRITGNRLAASYFNMDALTRGKNPKDYLSNKDIVYPSGYRNSCVQVEEWENLADDIIKERHLENASDEAKVYFFAEWLRNNTAYDEWRVRVNNNKSRAYKYHRGDDDSLYMYYNHVGQCWDYVNAMAIMCRHVGIPCADIATDRHTVTCVYMRDRWYAIDVSVLTLFANWDENPDPANWTDSEWPDRNMRNSYGYYDWECNAFDEAVYTEANVAKIK